MVTIVAGDGLSSGIRVESSDIFADFLVGLTKTGEVFTPLANFSFQSLITFQNGVTLLLNGENAFGNSYTLVSLSYSDAAGKLLISVTNIDQFVTTSIPIAFFLRDIYDGGDLVNGSKYADVLALGSGNDTVNGLRGADTLSGESGRDTLTGDQGNDSLLGGAGNDSLSGGIDRDYLQGDYGNDSLYGGTGTDTLIGGRGTDALYGGVDTVRDVFLFTNPLQSPKGLLHDSIFDMVQGVDRINLHDIDAATDKPGNQDFTFNGSKGAAHAVWFVDSGTNILVRADVTGDARADFEIRVANIDMLTAGDFIL
jgi:Ca2+-binding RTX toxin-like protein